MLWILVLIAIIALIFYIRKEKLESGEKTSEKTSEKTGEKTEEKKEEKDTTIIIIGDNSGPQRVDPFYTMTDPYWSAYNYRGGYRGGYGHRYGGRMPPIGHRRIW